MRYPPLWDDSVEKRIREEARNIDSQELPAEVRFCKKCVVSNQRPRIVFEDGVCSACRYAEYKRAIDWSERDKALRDLCDRHRKPSGFDVIVPCSGGKDSSTVAHKLKHEYGMNPLCVKWAPFSYTDIGFKNFVSFINSGFTCLTCWPDSLVHRKLSRLAFEYLGDAWQPFAYGQLYYPMHMAEKYKISLVMFGENGEAEYGGDQAANDKPSWDFSDWDRVYLKGAGVDKLVKIGRELGVLTDEEDASEFYRLPEDLEGVWLEEPPIEFHWMGHYTYWHPQGNYYYAAEHTGFEANTERTEGTYNKYASLDDRFDGMHYYLAYIKFGIGRATSDAAHEIRDGEIDRDEGRALVRRYDGEFPKRYFEEFKEYLGLDDGQFQKVVDRYRRPHIWKYDKGWSLRKTVWQ